MLNLSHQFNNQERANQLLKEAEQRRLARIAQSSGKSSKITLFSRVSRTMKKNTHTKQHTQPSTAFNTPLPDAG